MFLHQIKQIQILPLLEKQWQKLESHTEMIRQFPVPSTADKASSTAANMRVGNHILDPQLLTQQQMFVRSN